ncbi:MAG: hypothetical protein NVSMB9_06050 [Isosphaeraceae bacterium]
MLPGIRPAFTEEPFMQLVDFSPPSSPSLIQQRDALRKGLGRAMQWARTRRLDDDMLLEACLRDLRYNTQVEESRGEWLWQMIRAVEAVDRFRIPILHALYELCDERSANQLCKLACHYAAGGDSTFLKRLYEIVQRKPIVDSLWLGEDELIHLEGETGFLFAARVRGKSLPNRAWEWDDNLLVEHAIGRFGERRVNMLLENTTDQALKTFRECLYRQKETETRRKPEPSYREKMRAITVDDILAAAEANEVGFSLFRGWGMHAAAADFEIMLQHLWSAREPKVIANLLMVLAHRAAPRFDARLFELCRHGDTRVRRRAHLALEKIEHPLIREFALGELEKGVCDGPVIGLFARNYQSGDERGILEAIKLPKEDYELHSSLRNVIKVLEANPAADCSQLGVIAYASTPCELCRTDAARLLHQQHVAPGWLTEESRFDSHEENRELAAEVSGPP